MLRLAGHRSVRRARVLHGSRALIAEEALKRVPKPCSTSRRDLAFSAPQAPSASGSPNSGSIALQQADRRRVRGPREGGGVLAWPVMAPSSTQWRGFASAGGRKSGKDGDGKKEGMFDRLKKTFQEEIDKNPGLKKNLYKLKESEQQLRENRTLKENITKLKEAERKFRDNPTVKKNLSKLKDAEKKFREDAKNKQGEFMDQAEKAKERAEQSGGVFREKFESFKKLVEDKFGGASGGASGAGSGDKEGKYGAENDFVRASKAKFSEAQETLDQNSAFSKLKAKTQVFRETVAGASSELFSPSDKKAENVVVKKLKQPKKKKKDADKKGEGATEGEEGDQEEEEEEKGGVGSLMIVKTVGEAWERLRERLRKSPIIEDLLGASRVVASGSLGKGAKAVKDKLKDKVEEAQEVYETSQHPWVYKISSQWDRLTAESDEGIGIRELRRLDPSFSLEDWKADMLELFLPEFMSAFLRGDVETLKQWCGEACFNKLAAEARQRKADGVVLDPNVLDVDQGDVLTIKAGAGKANPTVAFQFVCQQINCVRNMKGEIVEGADDDIRATYYILAFQRDFDEDEAELRWKVVDMMVVLAQPYT